MRAMLIISLNSEEFVRKHARAFGVPISGLLSGRSKSIRDPASRSSLDPEKSPLSPPLPGSLSHAGINSPLCSPPPPPLHREFPGIQLTEYSSIARVRIPLARALARIVIDDTQDRFHLAGKRGQEPVSQPVRPRFRPFSPSPDSSPSLFGRSRVSTRQDVAQDHDSLDARSKESGFRGSRPSGDMWPRG